MRWWELLVILLFLADWPDSGAGLSAAKRISAKHPLSPSRALRTILAASQDSGIRSEASFGISSILGDGTSIDNNLVGEMDGILGLFGGSGNQAGAGNSATSQPDSGYLVVKVDLVSSDSANISALIQPILTEVEQLLEAGLLRGTFKLTWVMYDQ